MKIYLRPAITPLLLFIHLASCVQSGSNDRSNSQSNLPESKNCLTGANAVDSVTLLKMLSTSEANELRQNCLDHTNCFAEIQKSAIQHKVILDRKTMLEIYEAVVQTY